MADFLLSVLASIIAVPIVNYVVVTIHNRFTGGNKDIFWSNRHQLLIELDPKHSFEDIKKKLKILVIDDEDTFPVDLFRQNGYTIEKWDLVQDYNRLEKGEYDIIVLDIVGIAQHISDEDGMGILESLKNVNPSQIIIAYSIQKFDLSKQKFFKLADDTISKPSKFTTIKQKIDNQITTRFSVKSTLEQLRKSLTDNNITPKEIKKLERNLASFILLDTPPNWKEILNFINDDSLKRKTRNIAERVMKNIKL